MATVDRDGSSSDRGVVTVAITLINMTLADVAYGMPCDKRQLNSISNARGARRNMRQLSA